MRRSSSIADTDLFVLRCPICKTRFDNGGRGVMPGEMIDGVLVCFGSESDPHRQHPVTPLEIFKRLEV